MRGITFADYLRGGGYPPGAYDDMDSGVVPRPEYLSPSANAHPGNYGKLLRRFSVLPAAFVLVLIVLNFCFIVCVLIFVLFCFVSCVRYFCVCPSGFLV